MSSSFGQTSAEVAEEAEQERAGLVNTLDQLRENLRPSNVVDEVMGQARMTPADITDKVWSTARANPIPAALIGIGVAMLLGAGQAARLKLRPTRPQAAPGVRPAPTRSTGAPYRTASTTAGPSFRQPSRSAMTYRSTVNKPLSSLSKLLDEQPLVLAALGVAIGAAVGSAIPATDVEAQWMGDASESVRQNATAMAREQLAQLKSTATETLDQVKSTAAQHGVSADNLSGLVHDLGEQVKTAAHSVGQQARDPAAQHS